MIFCLVTIAFFADPLQWIDTEIKPEDKEWIQKLLQWEAKDKEMMEKRYGEEAAKKKHKKEEERRRVAAYREEREKKLERARRAKAAMEENPDAPRRKSGLVAPNILHNLLVLWFIHEQYYLLSACTSSIIVLFNVA